MIPIKDYLTDNSYNMKFMEMDDTYAKNITEPLAFSFGDETDKIPHDCGHSIAQKAEFGLCIGQF